MKSIRLIFSIPRFRLILLLAAVCVGVPGIELGSETYQMLTYYPAPYGSYRKFVVTGNAWIARDNGTLAVGTASPSPVIPGTKLYVSGVIESTCPIAIQNYANAAVPGMLRLNNASLEFSLDKGVTWSKTSSSGANYSEVTVYGSSKAVTTTFSTNSAVQSCSPSGYYYCNAGGWYWGNWSISSCSASVSGNIIKVSYASAPTKVSPVTGAPMDDSVTTGYWPLTDCSAVNPKASVMILDRNVTAL